MRYHTPRVIDELNHCFIQSRHSGNCSSLEWPTEEDLFTTLQSTCDINHKLLDDVKEWALEYDAEDK